MTTFNYHTPVLTFNHHNQCVSYLTESQKDAKDKKSYRMFDCLIVLAHHTRIDSGESFPSQERIAALTGLSVRTVRNYLREFEAMGAIVSKQRFNSSNVYTLVFDKLADLICRLTRFTKVNLKELTTIALISLEEIKLAAVEAQRAFKSGCYYTRQAIAKAKQGSKPSKHAPTAADRHVEAMNKRVCEANRTNDVVLCSPEQQAKNVDTLAALKKKLFSR